MRITLGLTSMIVAILLSAEYLGLVPDANKAVLDGRRSLSEALAVQCCLAAQRNDIPTIRTILSELASRNDTVRSAAVRRKNGELVTEVGDHAAQWLPPEADRPLGSQLAVPIYDGRNPWGAVEIRFSPIAQSGPSSSLANPALRLTLYVATAAFLAQLLYLKKVLNRLNPSSVVPERVRATLDALAEGVVILDSQEQIVLANRAFGTSLGQSPEDLLGVKPSEMGWTLPDSNMPPESLPWTAAARQGIAQTGVLLLTARKPDDVRTVSVSAIPILGGKGERRGVLATFDDVTAIKRKNPERVERILNAVSASDQSRPASTGTISTQAALSIGLQIERLAIALDMQDLAGLSAVAAHLAATAADDGVPKIAGLAAQLEQVATAEPDLVNVVRLTTELLDLCRTTQKCYLDVTDGCGQDNTSSTTQPGPQASEGLPLT
jgi:PAS domain S-box-containing protein